MAIHLQVVQVSIQSPAGKHTAGVAWVFGFHMQWVGTMARNPFAAVLLKELRSTECTGRQLLLLRHQELQRIQQTLKARPTHRASGKLLVWRTPRQFHRSIGPRTVVSCPRFTSTRSGLWSRSPEAGNSAFTHCQLGLHRYAPRGKCPRRRRDESSMARHQRVSRAALKEALVKEDNQEYSWWQNNCQDYCIETCRRLNLPSPGMLRNWL